MPEAEQFAALQAARLKHEQVDLELKGLLERHRGAEQLVVTAAFQAAIDGYIGFLRAHAGSDLTAEAIHGVRRIADTFEQHRAFAAAAAVLAGFASAADGIAVTAQIGADGSNTAQRTWLRRARALAATRSA